MIHQGDCLDVMATMAPESVDSIVTDPPYGLSFMGKDWDHGVPGVHFWTEALRVAKPGTHLLAFGGTRTFHRLACAIEDAGWEIRDCVMWAYGSGFPKSHNLKDDWQGWGTALKPAWEPIIVARKPLVGTVAENVQRFGTGAVNVDGCRIKWQSEADAAAAAVGFAMSRARGTATQSQSFGKDSRGCENTYFPEAIQGRWPANLIHDGSDEVTGLMGEAARFFYCAKASKADRDEGCEGLELRRNDFHRESSGLNQDRPGREGRTPNTDGARNHHPTVKPTDLMRYLCRLVTPPGGTVLDPFCGSGSTGKAARLEGFDFIGIELNPEYIAIANARINAVAGKMPLLECAK